MGSGEATACFGGKKHTESRGPTSQGEETPRSRTGVCQPLSITQGPTSFLWPSLFLGLPLLLVRLLSLGGLYCYIFLSSIHPPPTLVSHPCLSSSAHLISHSFWCSVSCCGPHHPVQGLHPHQWGQGVSCGYLIRM